jgi:hypothetical protein
MEILLYQKSLIVNVICRAAWMVSIYLQWLGPLCTIVPIKACWYYMSDRGRIMARKAYIYIHIYTHAPIYRYINIPNNISLHSYVCVCVWIYICRFFVCTWILYAFMHYTMHTFANKNWCTHLYKHSLCISNFTIFFQNDALQMHQRNKI